MPIGVDLFINARLTDQSVVTTCVIYTSSIPCFPCFPWPVSLTSGLQPVLAQLLAQGSAIDA